MLRIKQMSPASGKAAQAAAMLSLPFGANLRELLSP
jgi:hypothetical protein